MSDKKVIKNVLISVFNKTGLEPILNKLNEIKIIEFDYRDVVRHPLVSKIITAYQKISENED